MDTIQTNHIKSHLNELINSTNFNTSCLTVLVGKNVIGDDDIAHLNSILDERKKTLAFYQLIMTRTESYHHLISALETGCQSGAASILKQLKGLDLNQNYEYVKSTAKSMQNTPPKQDGEARKQPVRFDVRNPVKNFTGRDNELLELHTKLQQHLNNSTGECNIASIVGLGGIGKTELARKYIQEYGKHYAGNAVWINAETEEDMAKSFRKLAVDQLELSILNKDGGDKDITTVVNEVYEYFREQSCLFVFDNTESLHYLEKFMPTRVAHQPHILITSRNREWNLSADILTLEVMQVPEAFSFVKSSLNVKDDAQNKAIHNLIARLQCFPLALSQAVSHIKQRQLLRDFNIDQYLDSYEANTEKLLNLKHSEVELNTYSKTTFTTWKMTTDQISMHEEYGVGAIKILNIISYFQPDKIPYNIFLTMPDDHEDALLLLIKYSMIKSHRDDQTISIHRLVQQVSRIELKRKGKEVEILEDALTLLSSHIDLNTASHALSVFKHSCNYKSVCIRFKDIPWKIVKALCTNRKFYEAEQFGQELLVLLLKNVAAEDSDVIRIEYHFALVNFHRGNYENALERLQIIYPKFTKNSEGVFSDFEIVEVKRYLAICHRELGNYKESLTLLHQIFETRKVLHGLNHWQTIHTLLSIAKGLVELQNSEMPALLKSDDPTQLTTSHSTQLENVIALLDGAYETNIYMIGSDTNWTDIMQQTASCLYKIGQYKTSYDIAFTVYTRTKDASGLYEIYLIESLNLLGLVLGKQGKHEEAFIYIEKAFKMFLKKLGESHPNTLRQQKNMFIALKNLGKLEDAVEGLKNVLSLLKKYHPNHPNISYTEFEIACICLKLKNYDEGSKMLMDLKLRQEIRFGTNNQLLKDIDQELRSLERKC